MSRYTPDPVSIWFERAALGWLQRAYRHPGKWEPTYLAPPTPARRAEAARLGVDLDERDRWGEVRWVRGYKRAVYRMHKQYGYAGEIRFADPRTSPSSATALKWETRGLLRKAGWPTRRRELVIMIVPGGDVATEVTSQRTPAGRSYVRSEAFRSKPAPPDRPWEQG